jgi:thiol:disulfide interchange protein
MRGNRLAFAILGAAMLTACGQSQTPQSAAPANAVAVSPASETRPSEPSAAVVTYDPKRDAAADLRVAVAEATRSKRRILLEVGGEWCVWCHIMDGYFEAHPDLLAFREQKFVTVKVNFSEENENKAFLAPYPKIPGYPHIFVLESDGRLLHSQGTSELESGKSYDLDQFQAFLKRWAPV